MGGGDEFMFLIDGLTKKEKLLDIANRLIRGIEKPIAFEQTQCHISASIGIATRFRGDPKGLDALMLCSDRALYAAKSKGRACATFFEDLDEET